MNDKGAITLAIEALDKSLRQSCAVNPDGSPYLIEALEALQAFKDGVPEISEEYIKAAYKGDHNTRIIQAARHLQDAIK